MTDKPKLLDRVREEIRAAATQAQALAALLFLYRCVLKTDVAWIDGFVRAKRPKRMPVVLSRHEIQRVLRELPGTHGLLAAILYGAGLRLAEGLNLRVKDLDLARRTLVIRNGKGNKDRISVIPETLCVAFEAHLVHIRAQHELELKQSFGGDPHGAGAAGPCERQDDADLSQTAAPSSAEDDSNRRWRG